MLVHAIKSINNRESIVVIDAVLIGTRMRVRMRGDCC